MSANKGLFAKYPNRVFIETGSLGGEGIQQALDEGFKVVYSIELLPEWYIKCVERFKNRPEVHMILGDSGRILKTLISIIDEPVTFWLDGHDGAESTPIMQELKAIEEHPIKTHTIIVDDLRDWKIPVNGVSPQMIQDALMKINSEYRIIIEDGYKKKDIMVATI